MKRIYKNIWSIPNLSTFHLLKARHGTIPFLTGQLNTETELGYRPDIFSVKPYNHC